MKKKLLIALVLGLCGLLFTWSSIFWTEDIAYNTETITHLEFGWPFPFEVQDQSRFDPPFPYPMSWTLGNPTVFKGIAFFASLGVNLFILFILWYGITLALSLFTTTRK